MIIEPPTNKPDYPNCDCAEAMRYKTCYPCSDRVLHMTLNSPKVQAWAPYEYQEPLRPVPLNFMGHNTRSRPAPLPLFPRAVTHDIKFPICPCGKEINPIIDSHLYPRDLFYRPPPEDMAPPNPPPPWPPNFFNTKERPRKNWGVVTMEETSNPFCQTWTVDEDEDQLPDWQVPWTVFCKYCDSIWVPKTAEDDEPPPANYERPGNLTYKVALELGHGEQHFDLDNQGLIFRPLNRPPLRVNRREEWALEAIAASRIRDRMIEYQAVWTGYFDGPDQTWYPADNFRGARELIDQFHRDNPNAPGPNDPVFLPERRGRGRPPKRGRGRPRRNP